MKLRPGVRRTAWVLGAGVVAAVATAAPGAVSTASAQTTSGSPTLILSGVDLNSAGLDLSNLPFQLSNLPGGAGDVPAEVLNGTTVMQPILNGNERAELDGSLISMNDLARGATFHISVEYTDPSTGQHVTTNTVTFTTPPSTDAQPPTTPTNLHFVLQAAPQSGNYQLEFNPSTDNVDPQSKIQYVITDNGQISNGIGQFTNGEVLTVTAIDTSNNKSAPATITFDSQTAS